VTALLQLVSTPVGFIDSQLKDKSNALESAAYFLVISASVAFLLRTPLFTNPDAGAFFVAFQVASALAVTLVLLVSWKIVGGAADIKDCFVFYGYAGGVGILLATLFGILARGLVPPEQLLLFTDYVEAVIAFGSEVNDPRFDGLQREPWLVWTMLLLLAGETLTYIWMLICWPALTTANQSSRRHALVALALAFVIGFPISWLLTVFAERSGIASF
jgi:hypothetical protein